MFDLVTTLHMSNITTGGRFALVSAFLEDLPLMENLRRQNEMILGVWLCGHRMFRPLVSAWWDTRVGAWRKRGDLLIYYDFTKESVSRWPRITVRTLSSRETTGPGMPLRLAPATS